MAYDTADHYILLFGGASASGLLNDTWAFQNGTWRAITGSGAPSPRRGPAMAFDPLDGYVVLFGGAGKNNVGLNDTWIYRAGSWSELHPPVSPSGRAGASMVYDARVHALVMFGGTSNFGCGCKVSGNEWLFAHGNWSVANGSSVPSLTLYTSGMSYDPPLAAAIVFGGWDTAGNVNITFELRKAVWTTLAAPANLTPRQGVGMAYDPVVGGIILFGGAGGTSKAVYFGDLWNFTSSGWSAVPMKWGPSGRAWAMMAYDPTGHQLVLFGGQNAKAAVLAQTWVLR